MQIRTTHLFRRRLVLRRLSDNYLRTDIERFLPHLQLDEAILYAIDARKHRRQNAGDGKRIE